MIKVNGLNGRLHYLHPDAVASIIDAGPNWHGIRAYVRTFDGKVIEATDSAEAIASSIDDAHPKGGSS